METRAEAESATSSLDMQELETFRKTFDRHPEIATACAMHFCATHRVCPPEWLVAEAAFLMIEFLKQEKTTRRGRTAGCIARLQHERWDDERWFAVKRVQEIWERHRSDEEIFKARARKAPEERRKRAQRQELLRQQIDDARRLPLTDDVAITIRGLKEQIQKDDVEAAHRHTIEEKQKKAHAKRKKWLKQGIARCASRLLHGRDALAAPDTVYKSYKSVQKLLRGPTPPEGPWFDDAFMGKLGIQRSDDQKRGRNPFGIFDEI